MRPSCRQKDKVVGSSQKTKVLTSRGVKLQMGQTWRKFKPNEASIGWTRQPQDFDAWLPLGPWAETSFIVLREGELPLPCCAILFLIFDHFVKRRFILLSPVYPLGFYNCSHSSLTIPRMFRRKGCIQLKLRHSSTDPHPRRGRNKPYHLSALDTNN